MFFFLFFFIFWMIELTFLSIVNDALVACSFFADKRCFRTKSKKRTPPNDGDQRSDSDVKWARAHFSSSTCRGSRGLIGLWEIRSQDQWRFIVRSTKMHNNQFLQVDDWSKKWKKKFQNIQSKFVQIKMSKTIRMKTKSLICIEQTVQKLYKHIVQCVCVCV